MKKVCLCSPSPTSVRISNTSCGTPARTWKIFTLYKTLGPKMVGAAKDVPEVSEDAGDSEVSATGCVDDSLLELKSLFATCEVCDEEADWFALIGLGGGG